MPKPVDFDLMPWSELRQHPAVLAFHRRVNAMRLTRGAGSGRPKVPRKCPGCGTTEPSAREYRKHRCDAPVVTCSHQTVGTTDNPEVYYCLDCGALQPRSAFPAAT